MTTQPRDLSPKAALLDPNGVVVLKTSRVRRFWLLVGALLLAGAGVVVLATEQASFLGLTGIALFGLGAVICFIQLVRPDSLTLGATDFSYTSLGRRTRVAWADVAEFGVLNLPVRGGSVKQVGIRMKTPGSALLRRMNSGMTGGFESALPDSYGLSVEGLTVLMEEWRTASVARP